MAVSLLTHLMPTALVPTVARDLGGGLAPEGKTYTPIHHPDPSLRSGRKRPYDKISKMRRIFVMTLLLASTSEGFAQHSHSASPPKPAVLESGMGNHHHPVSTTNAEAQKFFDQGLTFVYAFNHDE